MLIGKDESDLANRLIQIYFSFFKSNVKKGEIDSKLMSALLTGVNRAFPYASLAREKLEEQTQVTYGRESYGVVLTTIFDVTISISGHVSFGAFTEFQFKHPSFSIALPNHGLW